MASALLISCPHTFTKDNLPGYFSTSDLFRPELDPMKIESDESLEPSEEIGLASILDDDQGSKRKKMDCLKLSLEMLQQMLEMYAGIEAFVEIFGQFVRIIENISESNDVSNTWAKVNKAFIIFSLCSMKANKNILKLFFNN